MSAMPQPRPEQGPNSTMGGEQMDQRVQFVIGPLRAIRIEAGGEPIATTFKDRNDELRTVTLTREELEKYTLTGSLDTEGTLEINLSHKILQVVETDQDSGEEKRRLPSDDEVFDAGRAIAAIHLNQARQ